MTSKPATGTIYFIEAIGVKRIKIGFTAHSVAARILSLRTSSAVPLRLLGTMPGSADGERQLHQRFDRLRSHGEWFRDAPTLRDYIRENVAPETADPTMGAIRPRPRRTEIPDRVTVKLKGGPNPDQRFALDGKQARRAMRRGLTQNEYGFKYRFTTGYPYKEGDRVPKTLTLFYEPVQVPNP